MSLELEQLVEKFISEDKHREKQQVEELLSLKGEDVANLIVKHIDQTAANRCLYSTQILLSVYSTLKTALETNNTKELKKCTISIVDQLNLFKNRVIDQQNQERSCEAK